MISIASRIEKAIYNNEKCETSIFKIPPSNDQRPTAVTAESLGTHNDEDERSEVEHNRTEEIKEKQPKFSDPLSNPSKKSKRSHNTQSAGLKHKNEESKSSFPAKRIGGHRDSDNDSVEELDSSPRHTKIIKQPKSIQPATTGTGFTYNSGNYNYSAKFDRKEESGFEPMVRAHDHPEFQEDVSGNIMNYLSGGFNMIKEK